MLTYSFNNRNGRSLYEYLYMCIKEDIISGKLSPDTKLPSKRDFAKNHGISVVTVENAYGQLLAEGYIYSLPKKGFYVSDINNNISQSSYSVIKTPDTNNTENVSKTNSGMSDTDNNSDNPVYIKPSAPAEFINLVSSHTPHDNFPFPYGQSLCAMSLLMKVTIL